MADRKERSIEGALWKQNNEGNNRPVYKGTITVKKDHVTDIKMGEADLKILTAKIEKEGIRIKPQAHPRDILAVESDVKVLVSV